MQMTLNEFDAVRVVYGSVFFQIVRSADPVFCDQDREMISFIYLSESIPETDGIYNPSVFSSSYIWIFRRALDALFAKHDLLVSGTRRYVRSITAAGRDCRR